MSLAQTIKTKEVKSGTLRPLSKTLSFTFKCLVVQVFIMTLQALPTHANESRVGLGLGILTLAGYQDFQIIYQPEKSHWLFGFRHLRGTEKWRDPYGGTVDVKTTNTKTGPTAFYLFKNETDRTFYLGASLLKWSLTLTDSRAGESDTDSTVAPFFGGGYFGWLGAQGYFNIGGLASLGGNLSTQTSLSSEEAAGIDVQLHLGIVF